jgi:enoyl-CoA hydratase/carnithine racemase
MGSADWRRLQTAASTLSRTVHAVVVRGYGDMFCAGSDMREWQDASGAQVDASFAQMEAALQAVEAIPVPTVAVVQGAATGAGCQLALACDVQLVARSARVGMPVAQLGILLSAAFATRLSVRVGPARAKELLFSGRLLAAPEAAAIGLVSRAIDDEDLEPELNALLKTWGAQPTSALRAAKAAVNAGVAPAIEAARRAQHKPSSDPEELPHRVHTFLHRNNSDTEATL